MEEETGFRQSTTPPDTMEDYRSAVADSTSSHHHHGTSSSNEPVLNTYRQIDPPDNDASIIRPTVTGYVNGGLSINNRPRLAEPPPVDGGTVTLEVDMDNKMPDTYAKLDDARANYHMVRSASYQYSPERAQNALNPIYKGVPNYSKKEKRQACRSCFLHCCLCILILTNVAGLILGGFNLANTYHVGVITSGTQSVTSSSSVSDQNDTIQQLRKELDYLRANFNLFNDVHAINFSTVKEHLAELQQIVDSISATPPPPPPTPAVNVTASTPSPDVSISLLYDDCTFEVASECTTRPNTGTSPQQVFQYCSTSSHPSAVDGTHVTEVFCSIDSDQIQPVTSSLSFNREDGTWSCICQGLNITHAVELEGLHSFNCQLYFKRCPSAISIPRN